MKLSMSIVKNMIEQYVILEQINNDEMLLEACEVYDGDTCSFQPFYLYLFRAEDFLKPQDFIHDTSVICCGIPENFDIEEYRHINLLILENTSMEKILNVIIFIFRKYNILSERFNQLIYRDVSFQEIIDVATEMVETPLCMLDLNHNVLAISSEMNSPDDALWQAMKDGYGYAYYDLVSSSEPKIMDIIKSEPPTVEVISNIGGHYLKVSALLNGRHAVAVLGMHKYHDFDTPFEKFRIQIFDYVVEMINENLKMYYDKKADRGLLYEQFLFDIIEEKLTDQKSINQHLLKLGFKLSSKYQMGLISFRKDILRTDYYITMLNYIERIIKNSKCVFLESYIYIIIPLNGELYLKNEIQSKLSDFLNSNDSFLILSSDFKSLKELPNINKMFKFIMNLVEKNKKTKSIYHFYEYANIYSMYLLAKNSQTNNLYHPSVQKLLDHDREHNSDYFETLKIYMSNQNSTTITSNILHMHRNSLKYRMDRIEELLGDELQCPEIREQMLFCMKFLEYSDFFDKN